MNISDAATRGIPIFDGHNDSLLRMYADGISFLERNEMAGLDFPLACQGGYAGAFFAVYIPPAGLKMPRKATYFTPKPRSGLILAEI